ncbi:DUF3325 family protein [Sphingopyxis sp. JAI128]|uniref:DUF3325 family protein n=1 Tax=Sphingopyxis sp. JAI128 TaxID=2723066 RepID=UPI00183CE2EA|nr:DUF3325 family protein [Sphingopyxis sp. JAI128]MBB6425052.1 hypothetical protein [Sphingopyxis sp. JAI128]
MSLLSLSMQRHARDAGVTADPRWARRIGWAGVLLLLAAALAAPNWRFALVEWVGLAAVAAALIVLTLYGRPRALPKLATGGGLLAAAAAALLHLVD